MTPSYASSRASPACRRAPTASASRPAPPAERARAARDAQRAGSARRSLAERAQKQRAVLRRALLCGEVDVHDAITQRVALRPFEVVHQRPGEIAVHGHAGPARLGDLLEV